MDNPPLVSVIVITYNSAATVTETLDSIKNQDYQNIELIVSDDCSKDDTTGIVENWLDENGSCFVSSRLVTTSINTGVSANLNRGIAKSHGTWIKPIAGDDLLLPDCISTNVLFTKTDAEIQAVFSRAKFFGDPVTCKQYENFGYGLFGLNSRERYLIILSYNTIIAPASFIRRQYFDLVGGYNESIPFIEDWPFWIRMFKEDANIVFINKETVKYRMGSSLSLGNGGGNKFKESYALVLAYAYECQMQENLIYKMYAFLTKRQREKKSRWYSILLKTNFYYYYYRYLERKKSLASNKLDAQFK